MQQPQLIIGLYRPRDSSSTDAPDWLRNQWQDNLANGYNCTLIPVSKTLPDVAGNPLSFEQYDALPSSAFTRKAHNALNSQEWPSVAGVIDCAADYPMDNAVKIKMIEESVQWAKYLGMHSLIIDLNWLCGSNQSPLFYAEVISSALQNSQYEGLNIWIRTSPSEQDWNKWNTLRNAVGTTAKIRLHVVLDLGGLKDEDAVWDKKFQRWFGESIQSIVIPTTLFSSDAQGLPVLPDKLRALVGKFFAYYPIAWIIEGPCLHQPGYYTYRDHIAHIQDSNPLTEFEEMLRPSTDYLQRPMQPLHDQLLSTFYETFEKDPVKYIQYEKAVAQVLTDLHSENNPAIVMVLGAGRGPLVDRVINASKSANIPVKIYVIEKNPTAVITLQHRARDDWSDFDVTVVPTDMREWNAPEKADIIVSELLGSWGDNELSPECLDGAQHLLKDSGISIPREYTSWLSPISSARLHAKASNLAPVNYPEISSRKDFETHYVVRMGSYFALADEQPCFTFTHPNKGLSDNERFISLTFTMPDELSEVVVHGFRGTFDCSLYGEHGFSIADKNYSENILAWFPLYIPLETPITLKAGETLEVLVWRKVNSEQVWYEWMVKDHSPIHNQGGRSSTIELF